MASGNCTSPTTFILSGLTDNPKLQMPLFMVFLAIYTTTLLTNLGLITLISIDLQLQTPMYFFLQNLSFTDAVYSTVITPKMLATFLEETKAISYRGCILQYFSFVLLTISECLLLAVMAYDRYVAICKPLLYSVIMTKAVCWRLVKGLYFLALLNSLVHTSGLLKLSFCSSNMVNHFFCDNSPLFQISSSSTTLNELLVFIFGSLFVMSSIICILISYIFIILTVVRIRSRKRKYKAFSTCTSHLMAVSLFHGTIVFMYFRPVNNFSLDKDKIASLFYTVVIPMLNPLIYSWRNKEVKDALHRAIATSVLFH
ncbi:olfactory receptor-like protein COR6 [Tympanuchus pallidicinctus]|uniref:olfactory receptor-like protein COR6 n=1 Tax=Tympanuchus pallidicinctus TaxID=109042 RepID=UPI00228724D5|nr:olfactory receptor-like protein COR6 [Tympanuchus pallidicinctus]